uniref:Uncharacterized protein n=1 Tax=Anopheles culicifacies TaxID=139723 RepID=A0A182MME0_9DIPT
MYEEYYCEALNICEILIAKCEVVERDINVLFKIINTILEIVKRDYVSKRVVIDSLAAIHQIMHHLYHMEVIHLHEILREKLDEHEPRVICEYEKIKSDVESYELKIGVKDNTELNELATFISPLIKSVQYIQLSKPTASENESQENIIRYEKLYDNTAELIEELNANKQPTKPEETHSMAVDEMPAEETIDEDADATFKPFDMQWKSNLVDKSMKKPCLPKDPYDIAHMRAEEKEQQKEKVTDSLTIDKDDLSSIGENSNDELMDSEGSDATYVPYSMLSKTSNRGRGNQKVGIGSRTETDNRPTAAPVTLENANRTPTLETMPCPATQKVYTSLYTVEKHQEYSIHCAVNETNCLRNAITEGERSLILEHVNKIIDILSHGINTTGMS